MLALRRDRGRWVQSQSGLQREFLATQWDPLKIFSFPERLFFHAAWSWFLQELLPGKCWQVQAIAEVRWGHYICQLSVRWWLSMEVSNSGSLRMDGSGTVSVCTCEMVAERSGVKTGIICHSSSSLDTLLNTRVTFNEGRDHQLNKQIPWWRRGRIGM